MRLAYLYLRSRMAGWALLHLGGIAALTWLLLALARGSTGGTMLVLVIFPVGAAAAIGVSTQAPFGDVERVASRPLSPLRLGHIGGLIAWAVLSLAVANTAASLPDTQWVLVRNAAGYAGLALVAISLFGLRIAWWALLVAYAGIAFVAGGEAPWAWPMQPSGDHLAATLALVLAVLGLGVFTRMGDRDLPGESW